MPQRIQEDHYEFRQIIGGKKREELQKLIRHGSIFRMRGKNGRIQVPIPQIELPHIVFGKPDEGVGRGDGKPGDVIDKDGNGKKGQPGTDPGDGMEISVDLDEILNLLKEELQLPDMKPKPNQTYEEIRTVYTGKSKVGPRSLLHKKWTMKECMKRLAALGKLQDKVLLPGMTAPVPLLLPINDDKRYRQYVEKKVPSSNAVIIFMRDGSGSMDQYKCDLVSDISWWIELYIRRFYDKCETCHIWHDTEARVLSAKKFYELRYGGGTYCTSAVRLMAQLLKQRYNPAKWNIYGLYFGDGESFGTDNQEFVKILKKELGPNTVNMFGVVELLHYEGFGESLKKYVDGQVEKGRLPHVRSTSIDRPEGSGWGEVFADENQRNTEVKRVIKHLLGKEAKEQVENSKTV